MTRPSKERLEDIRAIHGYTRTDEENPLKVRDELLAEIDALRNESSNKEILCNAYQQVAKDLLKECNQLRWYISELLS